MGSNTHAAAAALHQDTMMSTAVAVQDRRGSIAGSDTQAMRRVGLVRPTSNPAEVMEAHKAIAEMVSKVLEDGIDFGEIPGTDGKKALLKAGAERLAFSIGASLELEIMEKEVDHQLLVDWTKRQKDWYNDKGKRKWKWVETHGTSRGIYRYVVKCRLVRREDGAVLGDGVEVRRPPARHGEHRAQDGQEACGR